MAAHSIPRITEEEYLQLERTAECKHEFVDGEIFAMAGGSPVHSRLAANWTIALGMQLRSGDCGVHSSDARVRTSITGSYVYPDLSVACGAPELYKNAPDALINPKVVVGVLSPSTADYDRGRKFELYREIPSLQDYVLVHAGSAYVEHFVRQADGSWICRGYRGLDATVRIASIGCTVQLIDAYDGVPLSD